MKPINTALHQLALPLILGMAGAINLSCAAQAEHLAVGRHPAPGADAEITLVETDAGDQDVHIQVSHLPPPERIDTSFTHYLIWFAPEGRTRRLVGTLDYDRGTRRGEFVTRSAFDRFEVLMTAEREEEPREPSDAVIFRRGVVN